MHNFIDANYYYDQRYRYLPNYSNENICFNNKVINNANNNNNNNIKKIIRNNDDHNCGSNSNKNVNIII